MGLSDRLGNRWGVASADPSQLDVPEQVQTEQPGGRHTAGSGERYRASARAIGDPVAEVRKRVHRSLLEILGPKLYEDIGGDDDLARRVRETIAMLLAREETPLAGTDKSRIAREVTDEILGHGPIEPLLRDPNVTEIMVNGARRIYVERSGKLHVVDAEFADEAHLRRVIDRIVSRIGRRVDEASPMVDARLPDGSRVNAVVPPVALDGSTLTIRKFSADPLRVADLIAFGTLTPEVAGILEACVRGRLDVVVSGGTGSGKTTTLNVLSGFIPNDERVVTVEDAAELQLHQDHVRTPGVPAAQHRGPGRGQHPRPGPQRAADAARPHRRRRGPRRRRAGHVAGHEHRPRRFADHGPRRTRPRDASPGWRRWCMMAGMDLPVRAIREQIASAVDLIIQVARLKDGTRRITHITEVVGMEGDVVTMQDLFVFDFRAGRDADGRFAGQLVPTGLRPRFTEELLARGVELPERYFNVDGGW